MEKVPNKKSRKRTCLACGNELKPNAYICPQCKEYQLWWRNEFKYWAGITGLIVLIGSGLGYSLGAGKSARDYLFPPDLKVPEFDTFGKLSFVNTSNQNVWIKQFEVRTADGRHDLRWDIMHVLGSNTLHSVSLIDLSKLQFRSLAREKYGADQGGYAQQLPATRVQQILQGWHYKEYVISFLHGEGSEYRQVTRYLEDKAAKVECKADVTYVFMESQKERVRLVPCIGVIKLRTQ